MKEVDTMRKNEQKEIEMRKLAKKVANDPMMADLIASILYDIVKGRTRRLTYEMIREIDELDESEEDTISLDVLKFLKNKTHIAQFVDYIREEILSIMNSQKNVSIEDIMRYSIFFTMNDLKLLSPEKPKNVKLFLAIAYGEPVEELGAVETFERLCKVAQELLKKVSK